MIVEATHTSDAEAASDLALHQGSFVGNPTKHR